MIYLVKSKIVENINFLLFCNICSNIQTAACNNTYVDIILHALNYCSMDIFGLDKNFCSYWIIVKRTKK